MAVDASGNAYLAGDTNESDFPLTQTPDNGVQPLCASCSAGTSLADAFVAEISTSPTNAPSVTFSAPGLNFGVQPIGSQTVPPQAMAVHNTGTAPLGISSIQIGGTNANDFSLADGGNCLGSQVAAGALCAFEIGFVPSTAGHETATVVLTDNAAGTPQIITVTGGGNGSLAATPTNFNFGIVAPNTSSQQLIAITNSASYALSIPPPVLSGSSAFTIGEDNCGSLNPNQSCTVTVNFTPTSATTYNGSFTLTYTGTSQQPESIVVAYAGTGGTGAPAAAIAPTALTFTSQSVGTTGAAESVTITNNGTAKLTMGGASLSGSGAAAFSFTGTSGGGCVAAGATLAVGASCSFNVSFSPATAGSFAASLSISDNAPNSPQIVQLSGSGIAPSLSIAPTSASFGTATMGIASNAVPVVVTNSGTSTITVSTVTVTGADAADFSAPNNCVPAIAAGKTCTINLSFNPTGGGTRTAAIQIADNAPNSPQSIAVSGSAVAAQIGVSPASFGFGGQLANTASAPETFTVTNTATAPAMLSVTSASVTDSTDFQVTNRCGKPVAAGATCTISVAFDPGTSTQSTSRGGTLVIASNSATNAQTSVKLTGSAADFELGPAVSGGANDDGLGGYHRHVLARSHLDRRIHRQPRTHLHEHRRAARPVRDALECNRHRQRTDRVLSHRRHISGFRAETARRDRTIGARASPWRTAIAGRVARTLGAPRFARGRSCDLAWAAR